MSLPAPLPRDARPHRRIRSSLRAGMVWGVAACGVNLIVWLIASIAGVDFQVWPQGADQPSIDVGPLTIVGATLFAALVAGIAAGILGKLIKKVVRWIIILGLLFTATSLAAPWGQPEQVPTSTRVVLTILHLIASAALIFGLAQTTWTDDRSVRA